MMEALKHLAQLLVHAVTAAFLSAQTLLGGYGSPAVFSSHTTIPAPSSSPTTETLRSFPVAPEKKKTDPATAPTATQTTASTPEPARTQSAEEVPAMTPSEVNAQTRASLVNILCTTKVGGYFYPISGSGVIISGNGVILTNAHVGQYFLLRDYGFPGNVSCAIRTGSPAAPTYNAELLYLPPSWIEANASQITAQEAKGTGENDYSFLRITTSATSMPLPTRFPSIPLALGSAERDSSVLLAGYPAGYIDGITVEKNLYASSAFTTIKNVFTFTNSSYVDLMSLGGTILSQAGSSGGTVVRSQDGGLLGIIATATEGTTTASRELRAITLGHIDRSLASAGQGGIVQLLSGDIAAKAAAFASDIAPALQKKLFDTLDHK